MPQRYLRASSTYFYCNGKRCGQKDTNTRKHIGSVTSYNWIEARNAHDPKQSSHCTWLVFQVSGQVTWYSTQVYELIKFSHNGYFEWCLLFCCLAYISLFQKLANCASVSLVMCSSNSVELCPQGMALCLLQHKRICLVSTFIVALCLKCSYVSMQ